MGAVLGVATLSYLPFAMFKILGDVFGGKGKQEPTGPAVGIVYVNGLIKAAGSDWRERNITLGEAERAFHDSDD